MSSHEKDHILPVDNGLPLDQEGGQWTSSDPMKLESEKRRRNRPRRFFLAFLVCSIVLLGLASVHSPTLRQKFSCHGGLMGNLKAGAELWEESKSTTLTTAVDNELMEDQQPNRPDGGNAYHAGAAATTTKLQLVRRETNSSVPAVTPSATAQTDDPDPDPTPSPTASPPKPSSEPPASTPSPTPSSTPTPTPTPKPSSTLKTSTTTPPPTTKSPTTKEPEPTATPTAPPSDTAAQSDPTATQSVKTTSMSTKSSSTSSRGQASPTTTSSVDNDEDDDPIPQDTTIFTTKSPNPTNRPPPVPTVIVHTSTRTSNGEVVIVESTITVQPAEPTEPATQSEAPRPPAQLQNAAARPEACGMMMASMLACAVMGILVY